MIWIVVFLAVVCAFAGGCFVGYRVCSSIHDELAHVLGGVLREILGPAQLVSLDQRMRERLSELAAKDSPPGE